MCSPSANCHDLKKTKDDFFPPTLQSEQLEVLYWCTLTSLSLLDSFRGQQLGEVSVVHPLKPKSVGWQCNGAKAHVAFARKLLFGNSLWCVGGL